MGDNRIELGLTEKEDEFVCATAKLYKTTYLDSFDTAFMVARAIKILRQRYYGSGFQRGFEAALIQYGYTSGDDLSAIDKSIRSNLKELLEHEQEVRAWWLTVPEKSKRKWLSPSSIYRYWKRDHNALFNKNKRPRTKRRRDGPSLLEQLAAAQDHIDSLTERITEIEQERDSYRSSCEELEKELAARDPAEARRAG